MIITWLCLLLISLNIFSQGANRSRFQNLKTKSRSIRNSIRIFGKNYTNYFKKSSSHLKKVLTWIRKFIDFGIRCEHTIGNYITCVSGGKFLNRIGFHNSIWLKIPSFLRKYMVKKPNKVIVKFNPSAIANAK